jgi:protein-tyrosine phosphatase
MSSPNQGVLFLCTGNFYRSRVAEALFRSLPDSGWTAMSRGLSVTGGLRGLAPEASFFLEAQAIPFDPRDPLPLLVDELIAADHIVLLNHSEHEPMIARDFGAVYRKLLGRDAVTRWNIFDLPPRKVPWSREMPPSQPAVSALEHIRFAVESLARWLPRIPGLPPNEETGCVRQNKTL